MAHFLIYFILTAKNNSSTSKILFFPFYLQYGDSKRETSQNKHFSIILEKLQEFYNSGISRRIKVNIVNK
jgi:hypothetical protein